MSLLRPEGHVGTHGTAGTIYYEKAKGDAAI